MTRIAFTTLGCKANWVDTEDLASRCRSLGLEVVPFEDNADIYVVNTCTVTHVADQQSRQLIRRAKKKNPDALVIATGCMGEVSRKEVQAVDGVDAVFGTSDRSKLIDYIINKFDLDGVSEKRVDGYQSRARGFVKILDGCDKSCVYCIVPRARGPLKSESIDKIIDRCVNLAKHHCEIVLTGIDIGQYGKDLGGIDLVGLISRLIEIDDMPRIRISSIDPTIVDDRLVDIIKKYAPQKFCRHIHLSIQSASNRILKLMGRGYRQRDIALAINKLIDTVPDIAITGDMIAGFPSETDADYQETASFVSTIPFAHLHVFPYSEREGTVAAQMKEAVPHKVRKERAAKLRALALASRENFLHGLTGKEFDAIVTTKKSIDRIVSCFTDNAISIETWVDSNHEDMYAKMIGVEITRVNGTKVSGEWTLHRRKRRD